jgi:hypothetical protein
MLDYLRQHGCPLNKYVCSAAAGAGHLEALRYLHDHGCEWDELTCSRAAVGGHSEVLQYAREHGCPWNEETRSSAVAAVCHAEALPGLRRVLHGYAPSSQQRPHETDDHAHQPKPQGARGLRVDTRGTSATYPPSPSLPL